MSQLFHAFFSDESEAFRSPSEPGLGERVTVRLRVERGFDVCASVVLNGGRSRVAMRKVRTDELFDWYEGSFSCGLEPLSYRFLIERGVGDAPAFQSCPPAPGSREWGSRLASAHLDEFNKQCLQNRAHPIPGSPEQAGKTETPEHPSACGPERAIVYQRDGAHWADETVLAENDFRIWPGFSTPAWAHGAVQYQIFPDRFANGDASNDVVSGEYAYDGAHVRAAAWDDLPTEDDYRRFCGGDLQGVIDKLDYLQSIGVEVLYLNPIFVSPSSHKYDTQDFSHIDPHLGVICDDVDHLLAPGDCENRNALRYIRRTTSRENLERSDALFAELCREVHGRGMRIILDGVFNHCGSFSPWMDRERIYERAGVDKPGAFLSEESPFRDFFRFAGNEPAGYEAWWDFPTLPKLNYEGAPELCDRILAIARHWASPPYSIDGWRLDVAADVGHGEEFNHAFWRRFRDEVKRVNPNAVIVAEHYGNPAPWLEGDQWDTVMNYDAFMDPLTFFLTGMEKHSDRMDDGLYQDGAAFCVTMRQAMARFGWGSLLSAMNQLSNHDHSRFLTRTNRRVGRIQTAGSAAAGEGVDKRVMREAVVVQMTWPGAPTIYYGDEAGLVGWTDPDCRRTYPWGAEDEGLIELHRTLASVREKHLALRSGSFALLGGGRAWFAFGRFLEGDRVAVVCNNADDEQEIDVRVRDLGMKDGSSVRVCLETTEDGFVKRGKGKRTVRVVGQVKGGMLRVRMAPRTAVVLVV